VQRVYLGAEYKGPHGEHLHPSDLRENLIGTVLCVFAILFGVFPYQFPGGRPSVLKYMDATIDAQVQDLADWTREEEANSRAAAALVVPPAVRATAVGATAGLPSSAMNTGGQATRATQSEDL
jgi:NADH-quinone oxidoreductase subunit M